MSIHQSINNTIIDQTESDQSGFIDQMKDVNQLQLLDIDYFPGLISL